MTEPGVAKVVSLPSGRSLYVEKYDRDSVASGPDIPIVIIHGMYLTTRSWKPTLPYLKQYTRILYDSQGHGQTPPSSSVMTVESFAEDTRDVLTYFGYESAYVIGHSLGAYNAVNFAQSYPGMTKKLILVTPCIIPMPSLYSQWPAIVRSAPMEDLLNLYYYQWVGPTGRNNPTLLEMVRKDTEAHEHRREEMARFHEMALMAFEFKTLHGVDAWIISCPEDPITPSDQCKEMCEYIKAKSMVVEAGHYPCLQNPKGLAEAIQSIVTST